MIKETNENGESTVYAYDALGRTISVTNPLGHSDKLSYDALGRITSVTDRNGNVTRYIYDANGNVIQTTDALGNNSYFEYDAMNRIVKATLNRVDKKHNVNESQITLYQYDKPGNEYWYNNLNQQIRKQVDGKDFISYNYDKRGNLIKEIDEKTKAVTAKYTYDAANRMVKGINEKGEESHYIYNGLGDLGANEWIIEKNAYGYAGFDTDPSEQVNGVVVCERHKNTSGQGHINPTGKGHFTTGGTENAQTPTINGKYVVVHKDYVIDYTSELKNVLMEYESGIDGLTYRYTYGLEKNNVVISGIPNGAGSVMQYVYDNELGELVLTAEDLGIDVAKNNVVKLYYHHDKLGSTDYLTDNIVGKVTSYVTYDDWGELTMKTILKMGVRQLDLVTEYTGYMYDQVLSVYYAKARIDGLTLGKGI